MNVGVLTFYKVNNFGQFWQALSTLQTLENVDSRVKAYLLPTDRGLMSNFSNISRRPSTIFPSLNRALDFIAARSEKLKQYIPTGSINLENADSLRTISSRLGLDLLLTGADTCLNTPITPNNNLSLYWIPPKVAPHAGFLSSSCGGLRYESLSEQTVTKLRDCVSSLSYLYVRDRMTANLLLAISPTCKPVISPDPAFSIFASMSSKIYIADSANKPVCLVNLEPSSFTMMLCSLLEDTHRLISLSRKSMFPKMSASFPGPVDQLELIASSDLIVTSSFHETMAAAALGTPFIAIERIATCGREFGMTKISDLCIRLGAPERYYDPQDQGINDIQKLSTFLSREIQLPAVQRNMYQAVCKDLGREFQEVCSRIIGDAMGFS